MEPQINSVQMVAHNSPWLPSEFLQTRGVAHCLFSGSYPQSNGREEAAVKTAKHIIQENTASNGSLNTDKVAKAIM